MTDDDNKESKPSKVVRLFTHTPGHANSGSPCDNDAELPDLAELGAEVRRYMADARPAPADAGTVRRDPAGPPPGHRNAMRCPQCDQYTWQETAQCIHCGKNLVARVEQLKVAHRADWLAVLWSSAFLSWAIAMLCIYALQHYTMPAWTAHALRYVVYAIAGANALGFWIASMTKPN